MQSVKSLNKFIVASVLLHLSVLGGATWFAAKKERLVPVEISFGTGNSRGGSGPRTITASIQKEPVKKSAVSAPPKILKSLKSLGKVKTDAPKIAQKAEEEEEKDSKKDEVTKPQAAEKSKVSDQAAGTGSGKGTTAGSGSGTTSGSGAGFDDPKIRYRGMVYQLVNSKKKYPRKARSLQQEGTVVVKIKLSKSGKLLKVEIVESSSYSILKEATLDAIKDIDKFPEIPNELGLDEITFSLPFEYELTNGDFI